MRRIALFVEDAAHERVIGLLVERIAKENGQDVTFDKRNVRRGHGAVIRELKEYLRDLRVGRIGMADLLVVATDANCKGRNVRAKEIRDAAEGAPVRVVCAVPDPHIERWLLLDSGAFKAVFGKGCDAPDQKCERDRYKKLLMNSIMTTGIVPAFGGIEFAADLVAAMNLHRLVRLDGALKAFIDELQDAMNSWNPAGSP